MNSCRVQAFRLGASLSVAAAALISGAALAQEQADLPQEQADPPTESINEQAPDGLANTSSQQPASDEIIVTGTLLRGTAPVGSSLISATREKLVSTGSTTSNELLANIPQVTNLFGTDPSRRYGIAVNNVTIVRPNLRNISPDNASSNSTLVLFNGHRVAAAGVTQASIDPDLLPTAAIERVEVVTDGGSSTYGSDAVGGVINFITRKRFDGVQVDARYGFADDYWQFDANAIAGKDWDSGSAYIAYTYNKNSALFGRDRDAVQNLTYDASGNLVTTATNPNGFRDQTCSTPNFSVGTGRFSGGANGAFNNFTTFCDASDNSAVIPEVERHGVFASLTQELSDAMSIDTRAFYSRRETLGRGELFSGSIPITGAPDRNFYYTQIPSTPVNATQTANFSLAPALGIELPVSGTKVSEWGVSTELKADLTENWQLRTLFNFSESDSSYFINSVLGTAANAAGSGTTAATAINPYNVALTDPGVLARIIDNQESKQTRDSLFDVRGIVEGGLFELPGGEVRVAFGYEFMHNRTQHRAISNRSFGAIAGVPYRSYQRDIHAAFGEVQVPIFGDDNATPGLYSLIVSAQGRYDHYSDFGGTFNPKIGINYKPVEWFTLRGNWSKSFNAPTTIDQLGASSTLSQSDITRFSLESAAATANLAARGATLLAITGSQADLQPQTAETWSVGFDVDTPFLPGLRASLNYYNVKFNGVLKTPSPFNSGIFAAYPDLTISNAQGISPADISNFFASRAPELLADSRVQNAITCNAGATPCLSPGTSLAYALVDFRTGNYLNMKLSGLDWAVNYMTDTGFGSVDLAVTGNLQLTRKEQLSSAAPFVDLLETELGKSDLLMQTVVGANVGEHLRAQATWSHLSGYPVVMTAAWPQNRIDAFNSIDLFFKYDVKGQRLLKDLSFTFNVKNLFDAEPPLSKNRGVSGYENIGPGVIGRQFVFGVSKQF